MALIVIQDSVGHNGVNQAADVAAISSALVALGPSNGGVTVAPSDLKALAKAIEAFQKFQRLGTPDGKVSRHGSVLDRMNEILHPADLALGSPTHGSTGNILPLAHPGALEKAVDRRCWSPVEASLISDMVFHWTSVSGKGRISYFELDEASVPKWFGVLVPDGVTSFDKPHIFFHPTPGQAGYLDGKYQGLESWGGIFHYLSGGMGAQFCAAGTGRVLVMPLLTNSVAENCGIFPQRWESIVSRMLGMLQSGNMSSTSKPVTIGSVVVSSFSTGITYSHHFRSGAKLGSRLAAVIDFDGIISSYSHLSRSLSNPSGKVIKMYQMQATQATLGVLNGHNTFPLAQPRWGVPFDKAFSKNPHDAMLQIHGTIPQTMMFIAAKRAG